MKRTRFYKFERLVNGEWQDLDGKEYTTAEMKKKLNEFDPRDTIRFRSIGVKLVKELKDVDDSDYQKAIRDLTAAVRVLKKHNLHQRALCMRDLNATFTLLDMEKYAHACEAAGALDTINRLIYLL